MKLQSTVSSPMRFERVHGVFIVTCLNIQDKHTGEHVCSMVSGESRKSFFEAKKAMWAECKEHGIFNTPRSDNPCK
jgi:hypothetical protein